MLAITMLISATMALVFGADSLKRAPKAPTQLTVRDVMRMAHERAQQRRAVQLTDEDRAWFRAPVGGA